MKEENFIDTFSFKDMPEKLKKRIINKPPKDDDERRNYCYSKPEPLFESIANDLKDKVEFSDSEKKELLKLLDSDEFRFFINNHFKRYKNNKNRDIRDYPTKFELIKQALALHCSMLKEYTYFAEKWLMDKNKMLELLKKRLSNQRIVTEILPFTKDMKIELITKVARLDVEFDRAITGMFNIYSKYYDKVFSDLVKKD